ncbi:MAG TPA: thioredoxin domain-containing protein [Candidatus Angelobacter sp.]|nr:thioredoxin domain-containing protein [Candidatus Angelobacter sp.]
MARFSGILLNVVLFLLLAGAACPAQSAEAPKKAAPAAGKSKASAKSKAAADKTEAAASPADKAEPLSPEVVHRIQTEIRTHYNVPQQMTISLGDPKPGAIPGYDDLLVTLLGGSKPSNHEFLISKDRKTLAHLDKYDVSQDLMAKLDLKGRPVRGNPEAKVMIVNFDDFQCPFCSRMHATLFSTVFKEYGDRVKIVYKDYPLIEIHPWAMRAAIDGNCLGEQNNQAYWDFADYVHGNQKLVAGKSRTEAYANLDNAAKEQAQKHQMDQDKLQACVQKQDESGIRASMAEADKLGIDSTPTMFINGEKFTGAVPESELRAVLDRALADNGQAASPANAKK